MSGFEDILDPRGGSSADGVDLEGEPASGVQSGPWAATFVEAPADLETDAVVALAGEEQEVQGARWMPRVDAAGATVMPSVGDEALIMFDDNGDPWVVCWWEV